LVGNRSNLFLLSLKKRIKEENKIKEEKKRKEKVHVEIVNK